MSPKTRPELAQSETVDELPLACSNELAAVEFLEKRRWKGWTPVDLRSVQGHRLTEYCLAQEASAQAEEGRETPTNHGPV